MKTLKTPFALSLCIAVLTLCACGGGSAGSARSGQEAAEAPCLFTLYTIESVSEQDAFHTMFYEGTLYMIRQEENLISRFSPSGEIEDFLYFTEPRSPIDMYVSPESTFSVLCSEGENDRFCINDYSLDGDLLKTADFVSENWGRDVFIKEPDDSFYVSDNQMFQRDGSAKSARAVFTFSDLGVDASEIKCFEAVTEQTFYFALYHSDNSLEVAAVSTESADFDTDTPEPESKPAADTRQELTFVLTSVQSVQNQVAEFNKANTEYKISLRKFDFDQEDLMRSAITTDKTVDLIQISGIWDYQSYGSRHYLADISGYLQDSGAVKLEDFQDIVVSSFRNGDEIYSLPAQMTISTMLIPTDLAEGKTSWTIDEFLSFMECYPNALSTDTVGDTKMKILRDCLYLSMDEYIDFEAGVLYLDSADFQAVLERIHALPITPSSRSVEERLQDGEVVLWDFYGIRKCRDFADAETICGKELTIIGYPVSGKTHTGGSLVGFSNIVGVSALSQNKEAAYSFVEQYLSGTQTNSQTGFPTRRVEFEEYLRLEADQDFEAYYKDGYLYGAITESQISKVREACETASFYNSLEMSILSVIAEESESFFRGDKTSDEVCRLIQSRVAILLSEQD